MSVIIANDINSAFIETCKALYYDGKTVSPRGLKTKEIQNFMLKIPAKDDFTITVPERKLSKEYLDAELEWYKSGDPKIDYINKYSSFWRQLVDDNGTINSNYGKLALFDKYNGMSQFEWCVQQLSNDLNSRQAIINYNQPHHKYSTNKDFVCTIAQQFIVNNDRLDCIVMMRSNDLIYGFSYDAPWFNYLHKQLADCLNIEVGYYRHFATSMHVYENHFDMLETVASVYHAKRQIK